MFMRALSLAIAGCVLLGQQQQVCICILVESSYFFALLTASLN